MTTGSGFRFKQFQIYHDQCAMKVGTDGVLLGAWADITNAKNILDLGCGTGLIALMLAQRSAETCQIIGVEIEDNAYRQALENVAMSPWQRRISIVHQDIVKFCQLSSCKFDLIVANPPYFATANKCRDDYRQTARYLGNSSHYIWLMAAKQCLAAQGKIQFILPLQAGEQLLQRVTTEATDLVCDQICKVITKQGKTAQRMLLSFSKSPPPFAPKQTTLTIYTEQHQYHADVIPLFRPFYLKL